MMGLSLKQPLFKDECTKMVGLSLKRPVFKDKDAKRIRDSGGEYDR